MDSQARSTVPDVWRDQFVAIRTVDGLGLCAVQRFIYTCGLVTNLSFDGLLYGYSARYCYPLVTDALFALCEWDGVGDPPGEWIKEKVSGRGNHAPR